jgi:hypothetical protein
MALVSMHYSCLIVHALLHKQGLHILGIRLTCTDMMQLAGMASSADQLVTTKTGAACHTLPVPTDLLSARASKLQDSATHYKPCQPAYHGNK